ncbi:MAG: glycosyltransferase family 4 protein [bacterium]
MKILINTASLFKGGAIQVASSFIEECKKYPENEYHIILGLFLQQKINQQNYPNNFSFYSIPFKPSQRVFSLKSITPFFKRLENNIKPDVVFTTSGPAYWKPKTPHLVGYNLPHYIYPDSPYFKKISLIQNIKWKLKGLLLKYRFKREANAFVVQTKDVTKRLKSWLKTDKPIHVVSNTCSSYYLQPIIKEQKLLPEKEKDEFRLLLFSAYYEHKNFEIIPEIIELIAEYFKKSIRFVLTLEEDIYEKLFPKEVRKNILNVGPINPEEGPTLYKECDALFLPSMLECFSASYPEAMAMERPIITSDLGFAHAICLDAALYFKPDEPEAALKRIEELINNNELGQKLILSGKKRVKEFLSPEQRAHEYLNLCSRLISKTKI